MGVQIAKLTEKLELQQLTISATTVGESIEVWKTVRTIWASQQNQKGSLANKGFDLAAMNSYVFYCRYTPFDIKATSVLYNGQRYKVTNINHVPFREATIIEININ